MIAKMNATGLVEDVNVDYQAGMPELQVIPDRDKAAHRGVSVTTMGQEVEYLIGGQIFNADTQYPKEGHRYYIRVRSEADEHKNPTDLNHVLLEKQPWNERRVGASARNSRHKINDRTSIGFAAESFAGDSGVCQRGQWKEPAGGT